MKEQDKYYTPSIGEFHIGFEYEWLDEDGNWNKESSPKEITEEDFEDQKYGLRVKYFDKEDIESFGWRFNGGQLVHNGKQYYKYNNDYELQFYPKSRRVLIVKTSRTNNNAQSIKFDGTIKNKSKFKEVMEMLSIE